MEATDLSNIGNSVKFTLVVAHEDVIQIRKIIKAEIFNYSNMSCVLTMPLSSNGRFPVTHWTSVDEVSNKVWEEILVFFSILNKNDIFYACSRKYPPEVFWNLLGLTPLPAENWRKAVKIAFKDNKTKIKLI